MLKGKLSDFDIVSIFEMLNQQNKSGILSIKPLSGGDINIYFQKGNIVDLSFKDFNKSLEIFLVRKQIIPMDMLKTIMNKAKKELKNIITVLLQNLYITEDLANLIIEVYYDDAFREILGIKQGEFYFKPENKRENKEFTKIFYVEQILLENVRQRDEIRMLKNKIPLKNAKITKIGGNVSKLTQDEFYLYDLMRDKEDLEKFRNRILIKYFDYITLLYSMALKGAVEISNYIDSEEKEKLLLLYKKEEKLGIVDNKLDRFMFWSAVVMFVLTFSFFFISTLNGLFSLKKNVKDISVKPYCDEFFEKNYNNLIK